MNATYILALDQGTTSSRAAVFNAEGEMVSLASRPLQAQFPSPGWVEQQPEEIWSTQIGAAAEAIQRARIRPEQMVALGIANQRETALIWDRKTGKALTPAIVWQDRRTQDTCQKLQKDGWESKVHEVTGLRIDPYFSATKWQWMLHFYGLYPRAQRGELCAGTIDVWLLWHLTRGQVHATDWTNASRTLLMDVASGTWSKDMCKLLDVPMALLPDILDSNACFGETDPALFGRAIPIYGVLGDQQAALFGQGCFSPGDTKATYGTGCFMMMTTGTTPCHTGAQLITTPAWKMKNQPPMYALEGSIFSSGAVVQWLRDGLGIIPHASAVEGLARSVPSSEGVMLIPAFTGLGAPHWIPEAQAALVGISRGTNSAHIARAALESMALQVYDVVEAFSVSGNQPPTQLLADGGATANALLMQIQADILQIPVKVSAHPEATVRGAASMAWAGFSGAPFPPSTGEGILFSPGKPATALCEQWKKTLQQLHRTTQTPLT